MSVNNPEDKGPRKAAWWQPALMIFLKMSGWIVFPVIFGFFLGDWLENKWGSETSLPWIFLGVIAVAFLTSIYGLARTARREYEKMNNNNNNNT